MKILYMIDRANMHGSEQHLLDILRHFSKNSEVTLISFSHGEMLDHLPKIHSHIVNMRWYPNPIHLISLFKMIKKLNPDFIHCHQPKALLYGTLAGKIFGIKTIVTVHSKPIDHAMQFKGLRYFLVYLFHFVINFISQAFASRIIFVNNEMRLESFFQNKSELIYNWVSPRFESVNYDYKILQNNNKVVLVSAGSITYGKGYDLLINFFYLILSDRRSNAFDISLDILGEGEESFRKEILNQIDSLNLKKVYFRGYQEDLSSYYSKSTFFVLFSRSETFGLVYVEAMRFGLPIFSLNLDVLKEIIPIGNSINNNLSIHVDNFFSLLQKENYEQISRLNINESKKYSYDQKMRELSLLYFDLIGRKYDIN